MEANQDVRPRSEELVDLHISVVPLEYWIERLNYASQKVIAETFSVGFIRVHPERTILLLRKDIESQMGGIFPEKYVFLKHIGRCLALVREKQETHLKVKNFVPPRSALPEMFVLPTQPSMYKYAVLPPIQSFVNEGQTSDFASNKESYNMDSSGSASQKYTPDSTPSSPFGGTSLNTSGGSKILRNTRLEKAKRQELESPVKPSMSQRSVSGRSANSRDLTSTPRIQLPPQRGIPQLTQSRHTNNSPGRKADPSPKKRKSHETETGSIPKISTHGSGDKTGTNRVKSVVREGPKTQRVRYNMPQSESGNSTASEEDLIFDEEGQTPVSKTPNHPSLPHNLPPENFRDTIEGENISGNRVSSQSLENPPVAAIDSGIVRDDVTPENEILTPGKQATPNHHDPSHYDTDQSPPQVFSEGYWKSTAPNPVTPHSLLYKMHPATNSPPNTPDMVNLQHRQQQPLTTISARASAKPDDGSLRPKSFSNNDSGFNDHEDSQFTSDRFEDGSVYHTQTVEPEEGTDTEKEGLPLSAKENEEPPTIHRKPIFPPSRASPDRFQQKENKPVHSPSPVPVHREEIQGNESRTPRNKSSEPKNRTPTPQKVKLWQELQKARENRRVSEKKRQELMKKARSVALQINQKRNSVRDVWKRRYLEEKKKTGPLNDICHRLQNQLDNAHKKLVSSFEGPKLFDTAMLPGVHERPSRKTNTKIQATRLQHTIDELKRKLNDAKVKLTGEIRLRHQAEQDLKVMRQELLSKKIQSHAAYRKVAHSQSFLKTQPAFVSYRSKV